MIIGFIVGTGRCGSSLIHELLARHADIGFISNIEDNLPLLALKGRYNSALFRSPLGQWTQKGRLRFAPSEGYRLIDKWVSPIYANSCRDLRADDATPFLARRFRDFFEVRHASQHRPLFLHKYTGWPRIGFFLHIFPEARFIHVVRDGRAVANSWLQMPWWDGYRGPENWRWGPLPAAYAEEWEASGQSMVVLAGIAWKVLMDAFDAATAALPAEHCLTVRYEDFVARPREVLGHMLTFLGLRWNGEFDRHFARQRVDASRTRAYEHDLDTDQMRALQSCLAPRLRDLGYSD